MRRICAMASALVLGLSGVPAVSQNTAPPEKLTVDEAVALALAAQPGTVVEAEPDQSEGREVADIEIVTAAGEEIEFKVDLATGDIINVWADDDPTDDPGSATLENVTILIPGDVGGGWDISARAIGEAFTKAGLAEALIFENLAGENGAVGLAHMIENTDVVPNTLMLNTTQLVTRSLNGTYAHSYTSLVPVGAPIANFAAFFVHPNSDIQTMADLLGAYDTDTAGFAIGGGSAPMGLDHVIAALVLEAADQDPSFRYVQFEAPQPAFEALVGGQVTALATDYTRALDLAKQGLVRIIGVTAPPNYPLPDGIAKKMRDQGIDIEFVTWTGFFAAGDTSEERIEGYDAAFSALYQSNAWSSAVTENGWLEVRADSELFSEHLDQQHEMIEAILDELGEQ